MQLVLLATGCGPVAQSCPDCEQTTATDYSAAAQNAEVTGWSGDGIGTRENQNLNLRI
jgi:hypothetical protein